MPSPASVGTTTLVCCSGVAPSACLCPSVLVALVACAACFRSLPRTVSRCCASLLPVDLILLGATRPGDSPALSVCSVATPCFSWHARHRLRWRPVRNELSRCAVGVRPARYASRPPFSSPLCSQFPCGWEVCSSLPIWLLLLLCAVGGPSQLANAPVAIRLPNQSSELRIELLVCRVNHPKLSALSSVRFVALVCPCSRHVISLCHLPGSFECNTCERNAFFCNQSW